MQPSDSNYPESNPQNPPPAPQPLYENAPAPSSDAMPPPYPHGAPAYGYPAGFQPPVQPIAPPPPTPGIFSHRIPRWRWAMSLLLVGFYPAFVALFGRFLPTRGGGAKGKVGPALPSTVTGLMVMMAVELGIFAFFWGLAWAFSRANKDELLLRWRKGIWPILQGFGYALALRLGLGIVIAFLVMIAMMATGMDQKQLLEFIKQNQPKTDSLFSKDALANPVYLILMTTLLSFVVAGLREELWRNACLAALRHLFPDSWSETARWITAIAVSSFVFGLGHIYQGAMGVGITTFLGIGLGIITWQHRSIWPSVFAHGFIDATSFLAAALMANKTIKIAALWGG